MARLRIGRAVIILLGLLIVGVSLLSYGFYRQDMRKAQARIAAGSQIAQTPCGPIEYASVGRGPPVLIVHGAGGGIDQGIGFGKPLADRGFRLIAMSRFGYLRTPLPADASAAAQADAHACLMDALNIPRAGFIGVSAGAPSSMQFALRHPQRINRLVLVVPAIGMPQAAGAAPTPPPAGVKLMFDTTLRADFLFWSATKLIRGTVIETLLATPMTVVEKADAKEKARVQEIVEQILPVSPRRLGLLNDAKVIDSLPRYALEKIKTPTLFLSAADDGYGTFEKSRYAAAHIPRARFIGYESGGHVWVGHQEEMLSEIAAFLK